MNILSFVARSRFLWNAVRAPMRQGTRFAIPARRVARQRERRPAARAGDFRMIRLTSDATPDP